MKLAPIALGLLATVSLASPAFARGGPPHLLDPAWNPQHISSLPAEVRNAVAQMCGELTSGASIRQLFSESANRCVAFRTSPLRQWP